MAGLGIVLWLIGYLASLALFFSPFAATMGWILIIVSIPVTVVITWWWFKRREHLPPPYFAKVGIVWMLIAIVFDYFFYRPPVPGILLQP